MQEGTAMELIIMLLAPFPIGFFIRNRMAAYWPTWPCTRSCLPSRALPCSRNGTAGSRQW
jgi:hypothetical protein